MKIHLKVSLHYRGL